jgi:hypothetical protein
VSLGHPFIELAALSEAAALARADRLAAAPSPVVDLDVRGADSLPAVGVLQRMVDRLHERAPGRPLVLSVTTNLGATDHAACDWLVQQGALVTLAFDGPREAHEANRARSGAPAHEAVVSWIRLLHQRFAERGVSTVAAYVTGVLTVTGHTLAAGADATVGSCVEAGLTYVLLRRGEDVPPPAFLTFWRDAVRVVLARNTGGGLLVEKRLALHLEARGSLDPRPRAESPASCAACPHDATCGSPLLRRYLLEEDEKRCGGAWCATSMGTFDLVSTLLASAEGGALRDVYRTWMAARDAVMARLAPLR